MSTSVFHGDTKLKEMCLQNNEKTQRGESDIWCYQLQHEGGSYFLYKNNTTDQILKEEVEYELGGLEIEDQFDQTKVFVTLAPGEEHVVKLKATGGAWSISQSIATSIEDIEI